MVDISSVSSISTNSKDSLSFTMIRETSSQVRPKPISILSPKKFLNLGWSLQIWHSEFSPRLSIISHKLFSLRKGQRSLSVNLK